MIFNADHINDLCDEIIANRDNELIVNEGITRLQVLLDFKDITCVWAIYLLYSIKTENFELSSKIKKCIEIEKQNAIIIISSIDIDVYEEDYEILDKIVEEVVSIVNL
jgi:hypothetical protein